MRELDERFQTGTLDPEVWVPSYLAHWSSREAAAATYAIEDGALRLSIPPEQGLWCPGLHEEPLRVSAIQSGSYSGPVGSTDGPQPFRTGLVVREQQPTLWGYTPTRGTVEVRMRGIVDEASMFAWWLAGIEDRPHRSGEICVAEVFGRDIQGPRVEIGMGIHRFRDPALAEAFSKVALEIDVADDHDYAVTWSARSVEFSIDGRAVHHVEQSPDYPMQLMIGVFDFPAQRASDAARFVPHIVVSRVRGSASTIAG
jgi:hypothetical protein